MDLRGLHPTVMFNAAHALANPTLLRPLLEKYPDLASFAERMETVEAKLRMALDAADEDAKAEAEARSRLDALQAEREALEARYDAVFRATWYIIETLRHVEDEALQKRGERLRAVLAPTGRGILRYSVNRKIGEARAAEARLDAEDRHALESTFAPTGNLLEMHTHRFELAEKLTAIQHEISRVSGRNPELEFELRAAKKAWQDAVKALVGVMKMVQLEPEDRRELLEPIVSEIEKLRVRRARRKLRDEGAAVPQVANDAAEADDTQAAS